MSPRVYHEKQNRKQLDAEQIRRLLKALEDGVPQDELARRFGVSRYTLRKIINARPS